MGKDAKEIPNQNPQRGILHGIQKLLANTGQMLFGISKAVDSAIRNVEKLEQGNEKTSVLEKIKDIKKARAANQPNMEKLSPEKTR